MTNGRRGNGLQDSGNVAGPVRCAVYTRKSTDEGLEKDFNSLDAQREAGEAYVASQAGNGWVVLPDRYDDGGFSGGTLERPALKRLLEEVSAGRVQRIVVYKIDRLSRSLLDFARLAEVFEEHGTGIVSVTQQLDTATSYGRLTLNMLLSFAQFEREMVSDRTRDKVHAARRRGKFTGGQLVLGYDRHPDGGRLVVNEAEAERVRAVFEQFLERHSLVEVVAELRRRGWTLKRWTTREGRKFGGAAFDCSTLRRLLTNPVYVAEVHFGGAVYPAEHERIVDRETWDQVQALLRQGATQRRASSSPALLAGILRCAPCGASMTPAHSQKDGRRYRYYCCTKAQKRGWATCPSKSLPAREIEAAVVDRIRAIRRDPELVTATVSAAREQVAARRRELEAEIRQVQDAIDDAHAERRARMTGVRPGHRPPADPDVNLPALEDRLSGLREELTGLRRLRIDPADLQAALGAFTPVWEQMASGEQQRVVRILIERIDYNGETGKVAIEFRPEGARMLAADAERPVAK